MPRRDLEPRHRVHPRGDIDGEPQEVADQATRELAVILLEVEEIIQATVRQVENAGRQHALDEGVESPEGEGALDEWWRNRHARPGRPRRGAADRRRETAGGGQVAQLRREQGRMTTNRVDNPQHPGWEVHREASDNLARALRIETAVRDYLGPEPGPGKVRGERERKLEAALEEEE